MDDRIAKILDGFPDVSESVKTALEKEWASFNSLRPKSKLAKLVISHKGDLYTQTNFLQESFGLHRNCAAKIAMEFDRRANIDEQLQKLKSLKLTEAEWLYTGGPSTCQHKPLNGRTFKISEGALFNGAFVLPGYEFGCHCTLRPIINFDEKPKIEQGRTQVFANEINPATYSKVEFRSLELPAPPKRRESLFKRFLSWITSAPWSR